MSVANPSVFVGDVALPRALVAPADFRPFAWSWLDESIAHCFARQVALHPHAIAVQVGDAALSYEQLSRRSNRLAATLLHRLGRDAEPVAILASGDVNAVVAMMGILSAGKFFVAINPASSQLEMHAILADAGASAIVTDRDGAAAASLAEVEPLGLPVFPLDELEVADDEPLPAIPMTGATYAHIAYTSGSTGAPKGILKPHRALLHQSMTHINGYFITPADRMMAPAPLIFGASLGIVFSALLGGATLLPIRLKSQTAAHLRDWLRDEQVTVYHSVASFFRQFAATLDGGANFPHLRIIKLGGETIQPEDIRLYRHGFADHCVLRIGLASTEAGNYCWHFIGKETFLAGPTVPVGRPLVGTEILLLDEHQQPVAHGEIGEIAVKSAWLASGYWRNPALTQSRFLPDPADRQKQIYLTGDLGRWRDDGLLEHLGRVDQMVKIRGNRVEIGAVEAALLALPAINAAAVVAVEGTGSVKHLVAYLTSAAEERPPAAELRSQLQASLPDYMIPARYVQLECMPLTASGKVDRQALPPPGKARPEVDTPFVAPHSEQEQQIADIWAELLEVDEIGVDDNFFALGGDSLLAMRIVLAAERATGQRVPAEFFREATVAHLVRLLAGSSVPSPAQEPDATVMATAPSPVRQRTHSWQRRVRALPQRVRVRVRTAIEAQAFRKPYFEGVQWLMAWCGQPWVQALLYHPESQLVRRFAQSMGTPAAQIAQEVQFNLVSQTILARWKAESDHHLRPGQWQSVLIADLNEALAGAVTNRRWSQYVTVEGAGHLAGTIEEGRGAILVGFHAPTRYASQSYFSHSIVPMAGVGNQRYLAKAAQLGVPDANAKDKRWRAAVAMDAYQTLIKGGLVVIAGDEQNVATGVPVVLGDRQHRLSSGFAELAVATDALVLPFHSVLLADGRVRVVISPPLVWDGSRNRNEQISTIVQEFGRRIDSIWRQTPASVGRVIMAQHLALPSTERSDGDPAAF
ncbi:AMP-binding protein [Candidatus Chloroploca sp. Khr17]|uniref:LpxL/LpxP family acyltransferase n=1 Tax=Candidatus Chloroploca sp. Khr17 TaxID=2496869 RepID=UPI00101D0D74|nr:AMP-binding protein [Candidatus Chloroploca sp. Khr17]